VPIGASDDKKVLRLKFSDVTKAAIYREEHFSFADAESTERSAKVLLTVDVAPETPTGTTPLFSLFLILISHLISNFCLSSLSLSHLSVASRYVISLTDRARALSFSLPAYKGGASEGLKRSGSFSGKLIHTYIYAYIYADFHTHIYTYT
jgi:hypothetical protein